VCYFTLSSIFSADYKGIIYLVGLISACFLTLLIGQFFPNTPEALPAECNSITLNGMIGWSRLPFNPTILGFSFFYILWWVIKPVGITDGTTLVPYNLPFIIVFPIIIVADFITNYRLGCYPTEDVNATKDPNATPVQKIIKAITNPYILRPIFSLTIGIFTGMAYAEIIKSTGSADLQWFPSTISKEICNRPSKQTFKCNVYKNGQIISSATHA
jgi:hypothetical protein